MKASEWIDRVKTARGWDSDYRVAKEFGISTSRVANYRIKPMTLDEEMAFKVGASLGIDPVAVILDQVAERSKSPAVASALHDAARRLCILCKVDRVPEVIAGIQRVLSASLVSC